MARGLRDQPLAYSAPLERSSKPIAPEPAKASSTLDSLRSRPREAKMELAIASRVRSVVGKDRKTCDRIKRTAKSLGVSTSEMSVICGDTARLAESSQLFGGPFDVVFLDPPYAVEAEVVSKLLKDLTQAGSLTKDAVVVYEHSHKSDSLSLDNFELSKSKRYGIAQVDLLVRCEG